MTTLVVTGLSIFLGSRQPPLYQANSTVLLKFQNLASGLTGIQDLSNVYQDPARIAQTQTQIAMSPAVGLRVAARAAVPGLTGADFLGSASVTAESDSDVLDFEVRYSDPATATRLATLHAEEFIAHRLQLDTASLTAARKELRGRIAELRTGEFKNAKLATNLAETEQQLRTMEALQTANASLLRAADAAIQIQPKPRRNALLGVILGLMLGVGLAFAREALDTRVRTASAVGDILQLPLLARLPAPFKKLRTTNSLVMVVDPRGPRAEAFRMLRSNLEFVNLDRGARSILITSALEREGKSTTVANLAVVLARAGKRVALVDLDLRKPTINRFFGIDAAHPGLTSVVLGHATLEQALVEVYRTAGDSEGSIWHTPSAANGNGGSVAESHGYLKVLTSGTLPPDPGEFVRNPRLDRILSDLAPRFDFVLIDAPPLLAVGDAMSLSPRVDAVIAVALLNQIKRHSLRELSRALETLPTIKLGYIATNSEAETSYGYAVNYDYYDGGDAVEVPPESEHAGTGSASPTAGGTS